MTTKKKTSKTKRKKPALSGKIVANVEIIADDPYEKFEIKVEPLSEMEVDPPKLSGHCFYGVLIPRQPAVEMEEGSELGQAAKQYGIKLTYLHPAGWLASVRDLVCVDVTLTRDALALDHQNRLREFCKKARVPFRAQWVFAT